MDMDSSVRGYLSAIGRHGGQISKRKLLFKEARSMVKIREARRAYKRFHAQCFWSSDPELKITATEVPWIASQLMRQGGREAWRIGAKLCR